MIDINLLRKNPDFYKKASKAKRVNPDTVDAVLRFDEERRELIQKVEKLRKERNEITQKIKESKDQRINKKEVEKVREIKKHLDDTEPQLKRVEENLQEMLYRIPNPSAEDVPIGKDESENKVIDKWGVPAHFDFKAKDHIELGETLDIIDIKRAAKTTGARFTFLKGDGALLEFALVQFVFSTLTNPAVIKSIIAKAGLDISQKPFVPVVPPVMIRPDVFQKMSRLEPKEERYHIPTDDLYLIGSAEHTLGAMHMDETFTEKELPKRYVGFSTSFRREAGSYGKDTRGILRVHQFDKIEMESFTTSENSRKEQDFFVAIQRYFMEQLEIPHQVVMICTGDMGGPDYRQLDIEAWLPGQGTYRETHTADLMTDYQSRRLNIKVQRSGGKTELVHMNDATAFAIGRTIIAILENYQQEDGSVKIPKVLQKYIGKAVIKK